VTGVAVVGGIGGDVELVVLDHSDSSAR